MNAWDILQERGFLHQASDAAASSELLSAGPATFYVGFDPTGNSLHIGHLLPVMAMRWLQSCGHRPIALVGGGTAMIGDPSGKSEARPVMSVAEIDANALCLQSQLGRFLDFGSGKAEMVNNADWLLGLHFIEFLRDIGKMFSVNKMLSAESVRMRMETGLSFLEFSYPLLQAYDFSVLYSQKNCCFQFGGQDQWGNIVAGIDLTRRLHGASVYGKAFSAAAGDGSKFGKTAGEAVWLHRERSSPSTISFGAMSKTPREKLLIYFTALPTEVCRLGRCPPLRSTGSKEILATRPPAWRMVKSAQLPAAGGEFGFRPEAQVETSSAILKVSNARSASTSDFHAVKRAG